MGKFGVMLLMLFGALQMVFIACGTDPTPTANLTSKTPTPLPTPTKIPLPTLTRSPMAGTSSTPPNLKVAFIGDQGLGNDSVAVLELIRDEGAEIVLLQGDFDYKDIPVVWDIVITAIRGSDFPLFASIGNHDVNEWPGYEAALLDRLARIKDASCVGELGVNSACWYKGLFLILSGTGTKGEGHDDYIKDQLASDDSIWKICSWHKNHPLMQTDLNLGGAEWGPYEACRKGGAIIVTGHSHEYSRTHLMDNFETQSIASDSNVLKIGKGKSFVVVSGLGGKSVLGEGGQRLTENPWWAVTHNHSDGATFGALFCTFNENGVENRAHCYYKDIAGRVIDDFHIEVETEEQSR